MTADLTHVTIRCAGVVVGRHNRCWARHQTLTDPAHREKALELAHRARTIKDQPAEPAGVVVEARDLNVYDTIFGTSTAEAVVDGEVA